MLCGGRTSVNSSVRMRPPPSSLHSSVTSPVCSRCQYFHYTHVVVCVTWPSQVLRFLITADICQKGGQNQEDCLCAVSRPMCTMQTMPPDPKLVKNDHLQHARRVGQRSECKEWTRSREQWEYRCQQSTQPRTTSSSSECLVHCTQETIG